MPGLAAAAASIGLAVSSSVHAAAPSTIVTFGALRYEVRGVLHGAGLGGNPPACAAPGAELVVVVYRVVNTGEAVSGAAVPRLVLVDPQGRAHLREAGLSEAAERRGVPYLSLRGGRLGAGEGAVLADVFTAPGAVLEQRGWRIRAASYGTMPSVLPAPIRVAVDECPRAQTYVFNEDPEAGGVSPPAPPQAPAPPRRPPVLVEAPDRTAADARHGPDGD